MKHKKTVEVPARTTEITDFITCDMCGEKITHEGYGPYDVDEVEVSHRTGSNYPEGGSGTIVTLDMCSECFEKKLVLWIKSQGGKIREEDWDL